MTRLRALVETLAAIWLVVAVLCVFAVGVGVLAGFAAIGYRLMVGP